ncbi:MAG TPA: ABC transporter ATP-binding protein [Gammaproteobacteria bacterium]|nr:ABC transporter ATP-binding protein [Gammaproteobacteria bacterium]
MLKVRNLTRHFGGLTAVRNVNLDVEDTCIFGILGPNGAGKTTLFNLLSGIFPCSAGEIYFNGQQVHGHAAHRIARLGIGRTFQIVRPFSELTVMQNVLAAIGAKLGESLPVLLGEYDRSPYTDAARALLELTGLGEHENEIAKNLPLGMLRRLEIARALGLEPQLLLLDESFSGLSHLEVEAQVELVRRLRSQGTGILLIEHNMQVAMNLCERIAVLDHGEKIAEGSPAEIVGNQQVIEAYLGRDYDA